ncbi:hypothetical protein AHF37_08261 [Paragonimus kellicotti]|nr:hypothetical protein AHF37_08261 [Paragonimus kellicotti]
MQKKRSHDTAFEGEMVEEMNVDSGQRRPTMREREPAAEDDIFIFNLREHWCLTHPEQANDILPEIMNGHNLVDFFDPDIEAHLDTLKEQKAAMEAAGVNEESDCTKDPDAHYPAFKEIREAVSRIRETRALCNLESRARKTVHKIRKELGERGSEVDMQKEGERGHAAKRAKRPRNSTLNPYREASTARASVPRWSSAVRDSKMLAKVSRSSTFA